MVNTMCINNAAFFIVSNLNEILKHNYISDFITF